jgi:hypothetical protein
MILGFFSDDSYKQSEIIDLLMNLHVNYRPEPAKGPGKDPSGFTIVESRNKHKTKELNRNKIDQGTAGGAGSDQ